MPDHRGFIKETKGRDGRGVRGLTPPPPEAPYGLIPHRGSEENKDMWRKYIRKMRFCKRGLDFGLTPDSHTLLRVTRYLCDQTFKNTILSGPFLDTPLGLLTSYPCPEARTSQVGQRGRMTMD